MERTRAHTAALWFPPERTIVPEHSRATAHRRTRDDHSMETAEDYVEAVAELIDAHGACRVTDLAARFGVSHVTVSRIVGRLEKAGYITTQPRRPIELTGAGRRLAELSRRRHEIVYSFLRAIGVSEQTAAIDSEGIEHHVSDETLERFSRLLERLGGIDEETPA